MSGTPRPNRHQVDQSNNGLIPPIKLSRDSKKERLINDNVHGHFTLSLLSFQFIDNPCFQRLRRLKQLGKASLVFPTATHTRLEHSFGVSHLGRQYADILLKAEGCEGQEEWRKVAELAGLLHDLGHGPFSHVFENSVLPAVASGLEWHHEDMSIKLIDYMVDEYNIDLEPYGLNSDYLGKVKTMIKGEKPNPSNSSDPLFLWDLIANNRCALDVDKFDYLQRDAKQCNVNLSSNFTRLPFIMKVFDNRICYRLKEEKEVFNVFWDRAKMHSNVYQHRKTKACELMVSDVLASMSSFLKLEEKVFDPPQFLTLDDELERLCFKLDESQPGVMQAREIINRMDSRDLYRFANEIVVPISPADASSWKPPAPVDITSCQNTDGLVDLKPQDIRLSVSSIHYGMKMDNPIRHVTFFDYDVDDERFYFQQSERDNDLRKPYEELRLRVYSVDSDDRTKQAVSRAFSNWALREYPNRESSTPERHQKGMRYQLEDLRGMD